MASPSSSSPPQRWWLTAFNGERAVVFMFVACVLYSLPLSLLSHGLSLALLTFFALFVEIVAEDSISLSFLKTRPGASSGILLGTVTLPGVMVSKLIQLSRAVSLDEVGHQELDHLAMQYWATSASSFSVSVLLCSIIQGSPTAISSPCLHNLWHAKLSSSCIVLYSTVFCLSLATMPLVGLHMTLKVLWVLCHGLAAVGLIQYLLNTFPSCASIGEVHLVTAGLVLYFGDMLAYTSIKVLQYLISPELISEQYEIKRSEITIIIQGMLLGLLLFPIIFRFILQIWESSISTFHPVARKHSEIWRSLIFFSSLGFILIVITPSWMQFAQEFQPHPFIWVFRFVFSEPLKRLSLCIYWAGLIYFSVLRFYSISKNSKLERILLRKYYHLMAVSMFVPALIFQPKFLDLAFGAALVVFLALEIIRVWRIWPLGQLINQFMDAFTDHRDSDLLIVSHFSLLLGCALPIWMSTGYNDRLLAPFAGILSLGIGDTMASMVGHKYGVLRWSKTGKKTVEGTAAGITSVLASCSVLLPLLASTGYILTQHWVALLLAVTISGLLEAYTAHLDNAFIPLVFYSLLCL